MGNERIQVRIFKFTKDKQVICNGCGANDLCGNCMLAQFEMREGHPPSKDEASSAGVDTDKIHSPCPNGYYGYYINS